MKKLGFGFMRLPLLNKEDPTSIDMDQLKKMVDLYMGEGFTHFDTAYMYHKGESERAFKAAVADRYPRESYTLTDKLPASSLNSREDLYRVFDEQIEKTGVDYFDYYWIHNVGGASYRRVESMGAFDLLKEKKANGKAKHIGFSFHDKSEILDEILTEHPEVEFVQLQINYLDWKNPGVDSENCYKVARKHGKKVFIMEPVKGGMLASVPEEAEEIMKRYDPEASIASWAIRFAASLEGVQTVLSGMSSLEQMKDNLAYMSDFKPLSKMEYDILDKVTDIIKKDVAIACTGCRYCTENCPKDIAIPEYFALYNSLKRFGNENQAAMYFRNISLKHGKPSDCLSCGNCEKKCPQHLPIRELLRDKIKPEIEDIQLNR